MEISHEQLLNRATNMAVIAGTNSDRVLDALAADIALLRHHMSQMKEGSPDHRRSAITLLKLEQGDRRYNLHYRPVQAAA